MKTLINFFKCKKTYIFCLFLIIFFNFGYESNLFSLRDNISVSIFSLSLILLRCGMSNEVDKFIRKLLTNIKEDNQQEQPVIIKKGQDKTSYKYK